jgi:type I restriction enzyme R subunit
MSEDKKIYIIEKDSEADTCRKFVMPKLKDSKWSDDQIMEQGTFTAGRIIVIGRKGKRDKAKRFDYLLRYSKDFPIAIIEAKSTLKKGYDGLQQAKEYADILGLNYCYSTNGKEIVEYDFSTGLSNQIDNFPTPDELYKRLKAKEQKTRDIVKVEKSELVVKPEFPNLYYKQDLTQNEEKNQILLKPFYPNPDKQIRYYQRIAINKATLAVLEGKKRILLTLATGTGKTTIAFQIIYKLWNNRWNKTNEHRKPKILFLADRTILIDDPMSKDFAVFGDARCLISSDNFTTGREIYFATYQSIAESEMRNGLFKKFSKDFFDMIVIDECHRGSAAEESTWKAILQYFNSAVQIGLTATPLRKDNRDTYEYFGNPIYTYSLKQGIQDGFLAPYIVHRVVSDADAKGFRPNPGQTDKNGEVIEDDLYLTPDFENSLSYLPRTKAVAKHMTDFMKKTDRFAKCIVFCVNQEHAEQFRDEFEKLNSDLTAKYHNYVVRIVSDEGDVGKGHLSKFMDVDEFVPVVVTTSRLLSTGVDVPTCKIIAIFRMIGSMTEFKQIVGRGTRVRQDKDKLFFTILDYTGSATRNFADKEFDGEPPLITTEEINEQGETVEGTYTEEHNETEKETETETDDFEEDDINTEPDPPRRKKYYVEEGTVSIVAESVQILDASGKLRTIEFTQYAKEQITLITENLENFQELWTNPETRQQIINELESRGIDFNTLIDITQLKEADLFDVLSHVAFDLKPMTRRERAERVRKAKLLQDLSDKAKEIINLILDKYIEFGTEQLNPNVLQVKPIADKGNIMELVKLFGNVQDFKNILLDIQKILYAEAA